MSDVRVVVTVDRIQFIKPLIPSTAAVVMFLGTNDLLPLSESILTSREPYTEYLAHLDDAHMHANIANLWHQCRMISGRT